MSRALEGPLEIAAADFLRRSKNKLWSEVAAAYPDASCSYSFPFQMLFDVAGQTHKGEGSNSPYA